MEEGMELVNEEKRDFIKRGDAPEKVKEQGFGVG